MLINHNTLIFAIINQSIIILIYYNILLVRHKVHTQI